MRQRLLRMTAFLLLVGGGFLFADGCWIRTKAVVAQLLMHHAWDRSLHRVGLGNLTIMLAINRSLIFGSCTGLFKQPDLDDVSQACYD